MQYINFDDELKKEIKQIFVSLRFYDFLTYQNNNNTFQLFHINIVKVRKTREMFIIKKPGGKKQ